MSKVSTASRPAPSAMARDVAASVNFETPAGLTRDQRYAWMSRKLGRDLPATATWHWRLGVLVAWHGGSRRDGNLGIRKCADGTREKRGSKLFNSFEDLWSLGYKVQDPLNLTGAHVQALVTYWIEVKEYSDSTITNRLSMLRVFCGWVGKQGIVKATHDYSTPQRALKRSGIAERDKSWTGNGVDIEAMVAKVFALDDVVGAQLVAISAFGLRTKEARMFEPIHGIHGDIVVLSKGTKGGLSRVIPIETELQRLAADWLTSFAKRLPVTYLGWRGMSLKQARRRQYYVFGKAGITKASVGVTAHGLRHEYVHNVMLRLGLIPAVKGGTKDQMPADRRDAVFRYASRLTGHSRPSITCAYAGSFTRLPTVATPTTSYGTTSVDPVFAAKPAGTTDAKK